MPYNACKFDIITRKPGQSYKSVPTDWKEEEEHKTENAGNYKNKGLFDFPLQEQVQKKGRDPTDQGISAEHTERSGDANERGVAGYQRQYEQGIIGGNHTFFGRGD